MLRIIVLACAVFVAEAESACIGETCPSQSQVLLQHQTAKDKVKTGGFELGGDNTQSCSYERERLDNAAECREAAGALGLTFGFEGSYAGWPLYCFVYRDLVYFNDNMVSSSGRDSARLVCKRVGPSTTTTTTTHDPQENVVSYEIGLPGLDCQQGHVISTHGECASSEVATALGISFSNWASTHNLQFGCLYNSNLHSLFFNYYEGGSVDYDYSPVCKTETNPVIRNFDQADFDTNQCRYGHPIDDVEMCREAARHFGEVFSTDGTYSGYPMGCFKFLNGDVYFNRHEGNLATPNAAPICLGA